MKIVSGAQLAVAATAAALSLGIAAVARAAVPGSPDPSFGSGGVVQLATGSQLFGVAVQSDGEVVAVGQSGGRVLVERFTTGGTLGATFLGPAGYARGVAIQSNGDIVLAGTSGGAMLVERLTPALTPDSSFGAGGTVTVLGGQSAVANGVAVGPDGSIVAAGLVNPGTSQAAVTRLSPTGGVQWSKVLDFGPDSLINAVAVQPADGKVVLAGSQQPLGLTNGVLARLNTDGSLDATFASNGALTYHYVGGGYTSFNAVTLQNNGQIVVAGADAGGPNALFLRYNADGKIDTSFGTSGVTALLAAQNVSVPGAPSGAYGVGIAGGGAVVGAGSFENGGLQVDAAVWAVSASGAPETALGTGGTVRGPTGTFEACALAVAPDGSLVAVGDTVTSFPDNTPCTVDGGSGGFVARYIGYGPPPPPTPTVTTGAASAVAQTSATVAGQVNPNGLAATYTFRYGTSTSYGSSTTAASVAAGTSAVPVSAALTGLSPGTTYHYQLTATNPRGTAAGQDGSFTTAAAGSPPVASTGRAAATEISARVAGTVATGGLTTSYQVQYGRTLGATTAPASVPAATATDPVSVTIKRLRPATTYHYRLVATNSMGASYGAVATFKTRPKLRAQLRAVAASYRTATIATKGLAVQVRCNQPCSLAGSLVISADSARGLRLGKHGVSIGRGTASLRRTRTGLVVVRLTKAAKATIAHRVLAATLQVVVKPAGGGRAVMLHQTLMLSP